MNGEWKMENEVSLQTKAFYIFHCPLSIFHYLDKSPVAAQDELLHKTD